MTVLEYYTNEPITSRHKLSHSRICLMKLLINAKIASFQQIQRKVFYFYTSYAANTIIRFSSTSRIQSTLFHYPYYTHIKKNSSNSALFSHWLPINLAYSFIHFVTMFYR